MHKLSDEDIEKIVDAVCDKMERKLYLNIGKGFWGFIWRGLLVGLLIMAAYGAGIHNIFPK